MEQFESLRMTYEEQHRYTERALGLRWKDDAPVLPAALNEARRNEDRGDDLWLTYQRVQENLIRGGLKAPKGRHTRRITSPVTELELNRKLWALTEETAALIA